MPYLRLQEPNCPRPILSYPILCCPAQYYPIWGLGRRHQCEPELMQCEGHRRNIRTARRIFSERPPSPPPPHPMRQTNQLGRFTRFLGAGRIIAPKTPTRQDRSGRRWVGAQADGSLPRGTVPGHCIVPHCTPRVLVRRSEQSRRRKHRHRHPQRLTHPADPVAPFPVLEPVHSRLRCEPHH